MLAKDEMFTYSFNDTEICETGQIRKRKKMLNTWLCHLIGLSFGAF